MKKTNVILFVILTVLGLPIMAKADAAVAPILEDTEVSPLVLILLIAVILVAVVLFIKRKKK